MLLDLESGILNTDHIVSLWTKNKDTEDVKYDLCYSLASGNVRNRSFDTKRERDKEYETIQQAIRTQPNVSGRRNIMESIKSYFKQHQETYITLAIVILIDQFIFEGKFREKIKSLLDRMISKVEGDLLKDKKQEEKGS